MRGNAPCEYDGEAPAGNGLLAPQHNGVGVVAAAIHDAGMVRRWSAAAAGAVGAGAVVKRRVRGCGPHALDLVAHGEASLCFWRGLVLV